MLLFAAAGILFAGGAQAQSITSSSLTTNFSHTGDVLTLTLSGNTGSFAWNSAVVYFDTASNYTPVTTSCSPAFNNATNTDFTCTGTYTVKTSNLGSDIQVSGDVMTLDGSQHIFVSGLLQSTYVDARVSSTTTLQTSSSTIAPNQSVTYTATVTGSAGTPAGTVDFQDSSSNTLCSAVALSGGIATCTTTAIATTQNINVDYSGDPDYYYSSFDSLQQTVAGVSLSSTPSATTTVGQSYSQTNTASNGVSPYTYSISSGSVPVGTSLNASTGLVSGTPTTAGAFSYTVKVTDSTSPTATTATQVLSGTIAKGTQTISFTSSAPSATVGGATYTPTATATSGLTIALTIDPGSAGVCSISSGVVSFNATGSCVIDANQSGNSNWNAASQVQQTVTVSKAAPSVQLTFLPSSPRVGEIVTFTATVQNGYNPTGSVTFDFGDGSSTATVALSGTTATATHVYATINSFSASATYSGDANNASIAGNASVAVSSVNTTTTVTSSLNPSNVGDAVTLTATVAETGAGSGGTPTGTVTFKDGATTLGSSSLNGSGQASYATSALSAATHSITAVYGGDSTHSGSTSSPLSQVVQALGTVILKQVSTGADASYAFTSGTPALNLTITTTGGSGQSGAISLAAGVYTVTAADMISQGFALTGLACSDTDSTGNVATRTATIHLAPSETVTCTFTSIYSQGQTTALISDFLKARDAAILANLPLSSRRIDRLKGNAAGDTSLGSALMGYLPTLAEGRDVHTSASLEGIRSALSEGSKPSRFDAWFDGTFAALDTGPSNGKFAMATAGVDYLANPDLLIGGFAQIDTADLKGSGSTSSGTGWIAGPYVTARLADNLYLDVLAGFGTSSNHISPSGTYTDSFGSIRWMGKATLEGSIDLGNGIELSPDLAIAHLGEKSAAYRDSLGVAIPDVTETTSELSIGSSLSKSFVMDNDTSVTASIRLDAVGELTTSSASTDTRTLFARVGADLGFHLPGGVDLGLSGTYSGIGGPVRSLGGTLSLHAPLE